MKKVERENIYYVELDNGFIKYNDLETGITFTDCDDHVKLLSTNLPHFKLLLKTFEQIISDCEKHDPKIQEEKEYIIDSKSSIEIGFADEERDNDDSPVCYFNIYYEYFEGGIIAETLNEIKEIYEALVALEPYCTFKEKE